MNFIKRNYFIYSIIMIFIIFFNVNINSNDNIELSNKLRILSELSILNSCCKMPKPINCSRSYTYVNNNIKNIVININNSNSLYKTTYNHAFVIKKSKILIAIHCHISLFYHRYVFREIYRGYKNIQLLFFIGMDLNKTNNDELYKEITKYKDIVLFNFYCDYYKLCILTYNFLIWVKEYQNYYDIIIKQDTDTFLNINLVYSILYRMIDYNKSYIIGKIWNIKNKKKEYPSGMSYIFLSKSINRLIKDIDKKLYEMKCSYEEDMLLGLLSRKANFILIDSFNSFRYRAYKNVPRYNYNINTTLMIHSLRISEIAFLHYIITEKPKYDLYFLNKSCKLHD